MLSSKDLYEELARIEEVIKSRDTTPYEKAMLKAQVLRLKLALNNRSNLTAIMDKMGIPRRKPKDEEDEQTKGQ